MKQPHYLGYYVLLFVFVLTTSISQFFECGFAIHETYHMHQNGTGQWEVHADLTQTSQLIKAASLFTEITPEVAKKYIKGELAELAAILKDTPGIHTVTMLDSTAELVFTMGFQFSSIKALNEAIRKIYAYIDHPGVTHFKMDRHAFVRADTLRIKQVLAHYQAQIDPQLINLFPSNLLKFATYKSTYHFDKEIKKTTNALSHISEDRKTLVLKHTLLDACEQNLTLDNKIIF